MLRFVNLQYRVGHNLRLITVSATIAGGEVLLVKGPSGAGKSTLLRILARLQPFDAGELYYSGETWRAISPQRWRQSIHYLAQQPVMFSGTVLDNLQKPFQLAVNKGKTLDMNLLGDNMARLMLPREMLAQEARTLSGGEQARVALLRAVLLKPQVLLLDEPTAALDGQSQQAALDYLSRWLGAKPGRGMALVSHRDDQDVFHRVQTLFINAGEGGAVARTAM
ncbi:MAG: putative ABC transporter ATP-binding protein YbbL [Pelotomaculum sp. PtaB.Bin104]|nr:MAG: putative ABC transporter ATP-binding protein YbbL [Pelotomaculum sp. PtaB.Bin104]